MVVVEQYPDLKANQNFLQLQSQLEGTENRIAVSRRDQDRGRPRLQHQSPRPYPAAGGRRSFILDAKEAQTFTIEGQCDMTVPQVDFGTGGGATGN